MLQAVSVPATVITELQTAACYLLTEVLLGMKMTDRQCMRSTSSAQVFLDDGTSGGLGVSLESDQQRSN